LSFEFTPFAAEYGSDVVAQASKGHQHSSISV